MGDLNGYQLLWRIALRQVRKLAGSATLTTRQPPPQAAFHRRQRLRSRFRIFPSFSADRLLHRSWGDAVQWQHGVTAALRLVLGLDMNRDGRVVNFLTQRMFNAVTDFVRLTDAHVGGYDQMKIDEGDTSGVPGAQVVRFDGAFGMWIAAVGAKAAYIASGGPGGMESSRLSTPAFGMNCSTPKS